MDEQYRSNSHKSREREEQAKARTEKVVTGVARRKSPTGLSKAASTFLPGDVQSVKDYILMDVLIPSIKRAIIDTVTNGVRMMLGETGGRASVPGAKVNYRQYYPDEDRREYARARPQTRPSYDDVIFDTRADAEEVLWRMEEILGEFETVSVADMLSAAGISSVYTDNKYGWTDLRDAHVERVRDGYVIRLPRASSL